MYNSPDRLNLIQNPGIVLLAFHSAHRYRVVLFPNYNRARKTSTNAKNGALAVSILEPQNTSLRNRGIKIFHMATPETITEISNLNVQI